MGSVVSMSMDRQSSADRLRVAALRRAWRLPVGVVVVGAAAGLLVAIWSWRDGDLPDDLGACLSAAEIANASHDINRERRVLKHAQRLAGEEKDSVEVQLRLAILDWKYYHRFDAARERLLQATRGAAPARAWLALGRLEQARKAFDDARKAASQALEHAESSPEGQRARLAMARASIAESTARRRAGEVADSEPLHAAFADLHDFVRREWGVLEPSRLLLRAALLLDRGNAAFLAWRSYFHAAPGQPLANLLGEAGVELEGLLAAWPGNGATTAERVALVKALERSRLFIEASLVALDPRAAREVREHPVSRGVVAYARALERIRALCEEFYRQTALGKGDWSGTRRRVRAELRSAIAKIEDDQAMIPTSDRAVREYLEDRFGAYVSLGRTAGYNDLHMGHSVIDEMRTVEQYGRRAKLRFVALDNIVSNGFQSWAWESGSQHGGWARTNTIYQVRPGYADRAVEMWRLIHSPDKFEEFEAEMVRETSRDDVRARKNPYAFLPGLAMRLKYQGAYQILERLKLQATMREDLRLRFVAEVESAIQESSIFAHEGRHAIDKRAGGSSSRKLEFTAKLSEVAFAPEPRLALGGILNANIGDDTPHGWANLEVMKGLVRWMKTHGNDIAGLDSERPLLPQLDLFTDDQLREAFRSMDPLYRR